jgi:TonB family protein
MKKTNVFLILIFFTINISAQTDSKVLNSDTVFYRLNNGFINKCFRDKAEGFSIPRSINSNVYVNRIYYLQSKSLMAEYEAYDKKSTNTNNKVSATLPIKNGKYEEWYISGEKRVICYYSEDKLNGEFKVFYPNGNLKRFEFWRMGEWQSGECFDELGNKTQYCSYQEMAEYIGGIPELFKFIGKTLVYPQYAIRNGIEGKVYVNFTIDIDGSIVNVKIIKGVEKHLDDEAIRIIKKMPKWKPGRFEGNLVKTDFALPINFKLE